MEASDIRNLQEAYLEVYQELDEGEKPLPYGRMMKKSDKLASTDDKTKQKRAATIYIAANAPKGPKIKVKEQVDLYNIILSHLLDEGYANSIESAEVILENMSEGWIESICEAMRPIRNKKYKIGIPDRNIEPDVIEDPKTGYPIKKNNLRKLTRDERKRKLDY